MPKHYFHSMNLQIKKDIPVKLGISWFITRTIHDILNRIIYSVLSL